MNQKPDLRSIGRRTALFLLGAELVVVVVVAAIVLLAIWLASPA